ncbi:MAG: DUF4270 family protein [Chitinophagaceae bacterium]|nr:DUF4270 family protein [Chitinophagaceae bacterium]
MMKNVTPFKIILPVLVVVGLFSCYKNTIQFGTQPENEYTRLIAIDSVEPVLSTILLDSFTTNNPASFFAGNLRDPYLGLIRTASFFKIDKPATLPEIPVTAVYDSICLVLRLNEYYLGDTTQPLTIQVHELAEELQYPFSTYMYNTTNFLVKPQALGSRRLTIRPTYDDSVLIRLDDARGLDLYNKIYNVASDLASTDAFQQYLRGLRLSASDPDESVLFGILSSSGSLAIRLFYHHTVPYPESKEVDFLSVNDNYAFNQIKTDRSGTLLANGPASSNGLSELSSSASGNLSFMQSNAGLYSKVIFPSLRNILQREETLRLLKAELFLRPIKSSYDDARFPLPDTLYMVQTDGSNVAGDAVADSSGTDVQYAYPVIDQLYGVNTYYRFEVTNYIKAMLANSGATDDGFFILQKNPSNQFSLHRAVFGNASHEFKSELVLSVVTINN